MNDEQLYWLLKTKFGFEDFRPGQLSTLRAIFHGDPTLAILPTGAGKSLLYQLPAYVLKGLIVVVSPLISLMQDQIDRIRAHGDFKAAMLNSSLPFQERQSILRHLSDYRFLFLAPETLAKPAILSALQRSPISLFVIDEAHCISQWGPEFRPEYLLLNNLIQQLQPQRLLMLTATATPQVRADIIQHLGLSRQVKIIAESVDRPNIFLAVHHCSNDDDKRATLLAYLEKLPSGGIIYLSSRQGADDLAAWLAKHGNWQTAAYHAGLSTRDRFSIQQQFIHGELDFICATSAFGMGVDKNNIRYVIHYQLPGDLESYVQEIGRAGRDQKPALALLLYANGDEQIPAMFSQADMPAPSIMQAYFRHELPLEALGHHGAVAVFYLQHGDSYEQADQRLQEQASLKKQRLHNMLAYVNTPHCRRQFISRYFGENLVASPKRCCDNDLPSWTIKDLKLPAQISATDQRRRSWQERLRQLFGEETV